VKTLQGDAQVIVFSVAHTESYTDKQGNKQSVTSWVRCTKWINQGQSTKIADYLKKGTKVYVEGKPAASAYIAQDGTAKASLELSVRDIELQGSAQPQQQAGAVAQPPNPNLREQPSAQVSTPSDNPNYTLSNGQTVDDDLPF
jgi:single-strand DNA-binding protein